MVHSVVLTNITFWIHFSYYGMLKYHISNAFNQRNKTLSSLTHSQMHKQNCLSSPHSSNSCRPCICQQGVCIYPTRTEYIKHFLITGTVKDSFRTMKRGGRSRWESKQHSHFLETQEDKKNRVNGKKRRGVNRVPTPLTNVFPWLF